MNLITDPGELKEICATLHDKDYITVDTEFLRDRTYYPLLCLVQVASDDDYFAVDPLAQAMDLQPLFDVFNDENIVKVFHSARQDIEIILRLSGSVPKPLFDTQVAAMVCGFGASASYASLVSELVGETIDKSSRFTDWSRRPLSNKQLDYALSDVTHLRVVYQKLKQQLAQSKRLSWLDEEMQILTSSQTYIVDPDAVWLKMKPKSTSKRFLGILQQLAKWRELKAQELNKPRAHIIKDQALLEIAAIVPKSPGELSGIRGVGNMKKTTEHEIIAAIEHGQQIPEDQLPQIKKIKKSQKPNMALMELLRVLLKAKCEEFHVAEKLVATSEDLSKIALDGNLSENLSHGWRFEVFGQDAIDLKNGDIALAVKDGQINIVK